MNPRPQLLFATLTILLLPATGFAQQVTPAAGQQVEMKFQFSDEVEIPHLLYLPNDYRASAEKTFPLIFFLHGRGESKGPLSLVTKWGPPKFAARGDNLPYVILSPQCPADDWWSSETQQERLISLLDDVLAKYKIDKSRIYLTGLSMGGYGSWQLAANHPHRFAAVVPVCGSGDPADAEKLKDIPIWVFHGDQDRAVPFEKSVEMVEAIKQAGGKSIRFTSLEFFGHNSWTAAYGAPELYKWLDQQIRDPE